MINVLSLFSGVGGLDLGLERAGMRCVAQVELDPFCRRVLAKHWPEVPRHDDVRTCVEWWRSEPRPRVDLVCGGFPCQPVSTAGLCRGEADERWLWPAYADAIRHLRPRWAVLENVTGILEYGAGSVLGELATLGYDAEWDCLPASAFGAPHQRDRWIAIAYPSIIGEQNQPPRSDVPQVPIGAVVGASAGTGGGPVATGGQQPGRGAGFVAEVLADPHRIGRQGWARLFRPPRWDESAHGRGWSPEPDVARMAYGIPGGMDRRVALGNAVVPQVAEHVGRLIVAAAARDELAAS